MDSLMGATLQYSGYCSRLKKVVCAPGPTVKHITGLNLLTNGQVRTIPPSEAAASSSSWPRSLTASVHQVNFLSALLTAPATAALAYLLCSLQHSPPAA